MLYGRPTPIAEVKAAGDGAWTVEGYISTFSSVDLGGDMVLPGAFDRTLKAWRDGATKVRFLRQHDANQVLGVPLDLKVDDTGLFGRFKIAKTALGADTHELLKMGGLDSFSMGYIANEVDFSRDGEVRKLVDVDLLEASVVAIPMNPEAVITGVKALEDLPFAARWDAISQYLTYGVQEAEALRTRRLADKRDLAPQHLDALRKALPLVEAYGDSLRALIDATADVKAERGEAPSGTGYRGLIELRRRRLARLGA